jgi:hypothetical protein
MKQSVIFTGNRNQDLETLDSIFKDIRKETSDVYQFNIAMAVRSGGMTVRVNLAAVLRKGKEEAEDAELVTLILPLNREVPVEIDIIEPVKRSLEQLEEDQR